MNKKIKRAFKKEVGGDEIIFEWSKDDEVVYSETYVSWLESKLIKNESLHPVSQQSELLLQCYKEGFQAAVDSLVNANEAVKNKTLQ